MYNCIYFNIATMTTLGFANYYPISYIGKLLALVSSCVGIVNFSFLIHIIGGCFEVTFRKFIEVKSKRMDCDTACYIEKYIVQATENLKRRLSKHAVPNDPEIYRCCCLQNIRLSEPQASQTRQKSQFKNYHMDKLKESSAKKQLDVFNYPESRYLEVI